MEKGTVYGSNQVKHYGEPQQLTRDNQKVDIPAGMEPIENLGEKLGFNESINVRDTSIEKLACEAINRSVREFGTNNQVIRCIRSMATLQERLSRFILEADNRKEIRESLGDLWLTHNCLCAIFFRGNGVLFDKIAMENIIDLNEQVDQHERENSQYKIYGDEED